MFHQVALLAKDRIISNNAKSFLKGSSITMRYCVERVYFQLCYSEFLLCHPLPHTQLVSYPTYIHPFPFPLHTYRVELILRRDSRLASLLKKFESKEAGDSAFLEKIHDLIRM